MLIIICFAKGFVFVFVFVNGWQNLENINYLMSNMVLRDANASKKVTLSQKVDQSNPIREFLSIHMLFFNCRELH